MPITIAAVKMIKLIINPFGLIWWAIIENARTVFEQNFGKKF